MDRSGESVATGERVNVALRAASLCSGIGAIDLAVHAACGARTVVFCERDAFAAAILVARMEDSSLPQAPVWDDVTTFDGRPWRGVVDLVFAGFPCQPVSYAGKRRGTEDERWIWPDIARVLGEMGPRFVFLENTPGLLTAGFGVVLADLAALGFAAEWMCLRASDVGAPHERERWFLLAYADGEQPERPGRPDDMGEQERERERESTGPQRQRDGDAACHRGAPLGMWPTPTAQDSRASGSAAYEAPPGRHAGTTLTDAVRKWSLGDANGPGRQTEGNGRNHEEALTAARGSGASVWPPGRFDVGGWRTFLARNPGAEPSICRDAPGLAYRLERLRSLGNAVCVPQAAAAFRELWRRVNR